VKGGTGGARGGGGEGGEGGEGESKGENLPASTRPIIMAALENHPLPSLPPLLPIRYSPSFPPSLPPDRWSRENESRRFEKIRGESRVTLKWSPANAPGAPSSAARVDCDNSTPWRIPWRIPRRIRAFGSIWPGIHKWRRGATQSIPNAKLPVNRPAPGILKNPAGRFFPTEAILLTCDPIWRVGVEASHVGKCCIDLNTGTSSER